MWYRRFGVILICVLLALSGGCLREFGKKETLMQQEMAKKILRFHILANSDSEEDQKVKLLVRNAIGKQAENWLLKSKSIEESKKIIGTHMDEIERLAQETLQKNGYAYEVCARLCQVDFPEKTYGEYTFPKGRYEALQVELGTGRGQNWWCVLYPNMCFRGSLYEVIEKDAKESLQEVLSPQEYRMIFNKKKYKIRLKFLEYFK